MSPGKPLIVVSSIVGPDGTSSHHRKDSHNSPRVSPKCSSLEAPPSTPPKAQKAQKVKIEIKKPKVAEQKCLADIISKRAAISTFDTQERRYLPEPCITGSAENPDDAGLVTAAAVMREFKRAPSCNDYSTEQLEAVVSWIVDVAKKVFAITVQCHLDADFLLSSMLNFYTNDFEDDALPIDNPRAPDHASHRLPRTEAFSCEIWTDQRHDEFFQFQWTCLAPVFIPDQYEYDLRSQYILPFKRVTDTVPRDGSFSSVFKVIIHQDHQRRHSSLEVCFLHSRLWQY
jgi:hypothetical protein